VLGGKVYENRHNGIGWSPIQMSAKSEKENLTFLPNKFTVFHWHGDTFELPQGASRIASSEGCENQGFIYNKRIGLQFHLEVTRESLNEMVKNGRQELVPDRYVQSENEILGNTAHISKNNNYMAKILDRL
jgi:GMP synthase (glutamine-hydrolysing)